MQTHRAALIFSGVVGVWAILYVFISQHKLEWSTEDTGDICTDPEWIHYGWCYYNERKCIHNGRTFEIMCCWIPCP